MRTQLSSYEIMWIYVMFDLPVVSKPQRKTATKFRNNLRDMGYAMSQYSVYFKIVSGKEAVEAEASKIKNHLPKEGKVDIISITDKQYQNILSFNGTLLQKKEGLQQYFSF